MTKQKYGSIQFDYSNNDSVDIYDYQESDKRKLSIPCGIGLMRTLLIVALVLFGLVPIGLKISNWNVQVKVVLSTSPNISHQKVQHTTHRPKFFHQIEHRRQFIRQMGLDAWNEYSKHAWGYDSVKPVTNKPNGVKNSGRTIVASMSTLWVMGLKKEFAIAKNWVHRQLNFRKIDQNLDVSGVVWDYLGGLLSCYALTGDSMFVNKSKVIAKILQPAYQSKTGLSHKLINPKHNFTQPKPNSSLSSVGAQLLEYNYLSSLTTASERLMVEKRIDDIRETLFLHIPKFRDTTRTFVSFHKKLADVSNTTWTSWNTSLSSSQNYFYGQLVKVYIQSGGKQTEPLEVYERAVAGIELFKQPDDRTIYERHHYMPASSCQLGAILSLGAFTRERIQSRNVSLDKQYEELRKIEKQWHDAEKIADMCHHVAQNTKTGLLKAKYFDKAFIPQHYTTFSQNINNQYYLSHHLAESYFTLWRLTHDPRYRDYAWQLAQAIDRHCRTKSGGYSTIKDVTSVPTVKTDNQPATFLSATLKYLYLTFDDSILPLDKWVFNSHGHPLPVCGKSHAYPKC